MSKTVLYTLNLQLNSLKEITPATAGKKPIDQKVVRQNLEMILFESSHHCRVFDAIFSTRHELIQKVIRGEKELPWFWSQEAETGHTRQHKNESRTKIAKTDTQISKLHLSNIERPAMTWEMKSFWEARYGNFRYSDSFRRTTSGCLNS